MKLEKGKYFYHIFITVVSALAVVNLGLIVIHHKNDHLNSLLFSLDTSFCFIFLIDFLGRTAVQNSKKEYFKTHWQDLLSSIPLFLFFRAFRFIQLYKAVKYFSEKGKGRTFVNQFHLNRTSSILFMVASILFVSLYLGTLAFHQAEYGVNPQLKSPEDSLWWSVVTFATVGYGDIIPVTKHGRLVAAIFMLFGVGFFGVISGLITSVLTDTAKQRKELKQEVSELKKEILELKNLIKSEKEVRKDLKSYDDAA